MNGGKSKRVLILEVNPGGHHPFHVRLLLDSELAKSADMILASPKQALQHPAIASCATPFQHFQIDVGFGRVPYNTSSSALLRMQWRIGAAYRRAYFELSKAAPIDFVIVPYLDNCVLSLAVPAATFGGTPWLALTMRTMFHYPQMGVMAPQQSVAAIRRWLVYRLLKQKSMAALLTIDPTLAEFAQQQRHRRFRKIRYVPDPVVHYYSALPSKAEARQRLGIPLDARMILLYGSIDERKGTTLLVQAAAAADCSRRIHVVLAGKKWKPERLLASAAYQSLLAQQRVHSFDGFIDDEHEQLLLAAADCMWIGYLDFYGVSGVMALAGRHAVPVLASQEGLVGHFTRLYELGATIEPRNQASIVAALNRLASEPDFFVRAGKNGVAVFDEYHPARYQRMITEIAERSWTRQI